MHQPEKVGSFLPCQTQVPLSMAATLEAVQEEETFSLTSTEAIRLIRVSESTVTSLDTQSGELSDERCHAIRAIPYVFRHCKLLVLKILIPNKCQDNKK